MILLYLPNTFYIQDEPCWLPFYEREYIEESIIEQIICT